MPSRLAPLAAATLLLLTPFAALAAEPPRQIVVTGEGAIAAAPDYAEISIGATTAGAVVKDVMAENAKAVDEVLSAAKAEGVDSKDIQTSAISLYPQMNSSGTAVTGYRATNLVRVRLRDLTKIGALIDKAAAKGGNSVSGIQFLENDPDGLLDQARPKAFADAKRKAEIYAKASGGKVGRLLDLSETGFAQPSRSRAESYSGREATPVVTGENRLSVSVTATFEIVE